MPEFEDLRASLIEADRSADAARKDARTASIRAAGNDDGHLAAAARAAKERADAAARRRGDAFAAFEAFSDPRNVVARLDDGIPLLLLPLRVETRFKTIGGGPQGAAERHELWVRVYPDDCSVDTFDDVLSTAEVAAATRFWRETWRAGGVDAEARAAWSRLAGDYGAGRAGWIVQAFPPLNPGDKPTRLPATDIVLVLAAADLPAAAARPPLSAYWTAAWKANGNVSRLTQARNDLVAALGGAAAADAAIAAHVPFNLADPPQPNRTHATTSVIVAWLELPAETGEERVGWRRAPTAAALPERFVLTCHAGGQDQIQVIGKPVAQPLYVGPDPLAPKEDQITPQDGKLNIPEPLKWMFDFDTAVAAGMGFRVPLTVEQAARGFDRIVVLGVRLRASADDGRKDFEELLRGHSFSRSGFELLAQGSPTNNAEDAPSAYSRRDDPNLAYDDVLGPAKFDVKGDPLEKRDGQVFAERLGLDPASLMHARGADGRDAIEAQAMNMALAPGTLGYMAGTLMSPVFEGWVDELSWFFGGYVSGRGAIPAIRIGAQPYGIIATTAFSRMSWLNEQRGEFFKRLVRNDRQWSFLQKLHRILGILEASWRTRANVVSHVGSGGDPHRALLDILGLHPASVELHTRAGKHLDEISSRGRLAAYRHGPSEKAKASAQRHAALQMLHSFGYSGVDPDILDLFFRAGQIKLRGPIVEAPPLSETQPLAEATPDHRNYVTWLADAAGASLDVLRRQEGFTGDKPPNALLFIMIHFALIRGFQDAGDRLRVESGLYAPAAIAALRREPKSVHLVATAQVSDSPWRRLYEPEQQITGRADVTVADYLIGVLPKRPSYAIDLADQIRAVQALAQTPTAKLERALFEHVDTLTYRFDAWRLGLVRWQLERMRLATIADQQAKQGLYLGAYGWLENVKPKPKPTAAPDLPPDLAEAFKDGPPLQLDSTNGGHLHAPSLNQAVTAAMLRAGEISNRTPGSPSAFSINLASERVRRAMSLLDGVRTGQTVGALLGYRFERALHDFGGVLELDDLIFAFRRAFPLTAGRLTPTQNPPPPADEAVEARNVVDGLALIQRASTPGNTTYPYGKPLPTLSGVETAAVEKTVRSLQDIFDAMADLILAESVHQTAQGAPDRVAAQLEVQGDFHPPPDPDVVRTPARGFALTCRVGLELDPAAAAAVADPPRVKAQPALNSWLATALPPLNTIACRAVWTPAGGAEQNTPLTLANLQLTPIDVLHILSDEGGSGLSELDDRVRRHVLGIAAPPRHDALIGIRYMDAAVGQMSVFAASALVKRLRGMVLGSRPLRAGDIALPSQGRGLDAVDHVVARPRVGDVVADLSDLRDSLDAAIAAAAPLLADPVANRAALIAGIDARIALVVERLVETSAYGGAGAGWGSIYDWRSERFSFLLKRMGELLTRWDDALDRAETALTGEAALPGAATPEDHVNLLRAAEREISSELAADTDPVALRAAVVVKKGIFITKRDAIRTTTLGAPSVGLAALLTRCEAVLPITAFDVQPLSFTDVEDSIVAYAEDLQNTLKAIRKSVDDRVTAGTGALTAHDAALDAPARLKALQGAAQSIFGEDFKLIPTFALPAGFAAEQGQAHAAFTSGALLAKARTALDDDNPLDTWFYGVARVRSKVRMLEDAVMLWEARGLTPGDLSALQLPHKPGAPWLALDFPKVDAPDGERLAYVAFARAGYDPSAARCGLLLDDWAETIPAIEADEPGPQHTTGVAFNFDRPSQEPPQAMLLLTPAQWDGAWSWDDVLQGVVDTFELARLRAVEPSQLDDSAFAQFLPATVTSVTTSGLSISANYALVNMDVHYVRTSDDG
jgi:hypothetical protein